MKEAELTSILRETKTFLQAPHNDFTFSGWANVTEAEAYIEECIDQIRSGKPDIRRLKHLFTSLGPVHQVALMSIWLPDFIKLMRRFDDAMYE